MCLSVFNGSPDTSNIYCYEIKIKTIVFQFRKRRMSVLSEQPGTGLCCVSSAWRSAMFSGGCGILDHSRNKPLNYGIIRPNEPHLARCVFSKPRIYTDKFVEITGRFRLISIKVRRFPVYVYANIIGGKQVNNTFKVEPRQVHAARSPAPLHDVCRKICNFVRRGIFLISVLKLFIEGRGFVSFVLLIICVLDIKCINLNIIFYSF